MAPDAGMGPDPAAALRYECLVLGPFQVNTWIVGDEATGRCLLIDPGQADDREDEALARRLADAGLTPVAIVNTHGHIDHVAGVHRVRRRFEIPFLLHAGEKGWISQLPQQCALFGFPPCPEPTVDGWLEDGQHLSFGGGLELEVRHVPGHTPGGVVLVFAGHVLAGDTLFAGSVGRTDLPGGDPAELERSIRSRLYALPDDTVVHPGHGPDTTIGREKRTNPFVRA